MEVVAPRSSHWRVAATVGWTDPYLVWAEATAWRDFGGPTASAAVQLLIEARNEKSVEALARLNDYLVIPAAYRHAVFNNVATRFCTAVAKPKFFEALGGSDPILRNLIVRFELSMPVVAVGSRPALIRSLPRSDLLIGVIDDGCPFAMRQLRFHGSGGQPSTRVLAIWDQDGAVEGFPRAGPNDTPSSPSEFAYGYEADRNDLERYMEAGGVEVDEGRAYARARYDRLRFRATHGAHVLDLFAGSVPLRRRLHGIGMPPPERVASTEYEERIVGADIVFVQVPRSALRDGAGAWIGASVLDGVRYVLSRAVADSTTDVVVNVSYGTYSGPRNGTSILETALDDLVVQHDTQPRLRIVLPVGNSFSSRGRGHLDIAAGGQDELIVQVLPDNQAPTFVELWLQVPTPIGGSKGLTLKLIPPGVDAAELPEVGVGEATTWPDASNPNCLVVFCRQTSRGQASTMILVAIAPTASRDPAMAIASSGAWRLLLSNATAQTAVIDAYVGRNDANLGGRLAIRQCYFVDQRHDAGRQPTPVDDMTDPPQAQVRRRGTISGIATGAHVDVVAGYRLSDGGHPAYSSAGPTRGPRSGPTGAATSDRSVALPGVPAAGTRSAVSVVLVGTSAAAPQWARALANGGNRLKPNGPNVDRQLFGDASVDP